MEISEITKIKLKYGRTDDTDVEFQTIPKWDPKTGKVVVKDGLPKWSKMSKIR